MTKLTKKQVNHVAMLARVALGSSEEQKARELSSILKFVEKISELSLSSTAPYAHATGLKNVLREDKKDGRTFSQKLALREAPQKGKGHFIVQKVLGWS